MCLLKEDNANFIKRKERLQELWSRQLWTKPAVYLETTWMRIRYVSGIWATRIWSLSRQAGFFFLALLEMRHQKVRLLQQCTHTARSLSLSGLKNVNCFILIERYWMRRKHGCSVHANWLDLLLWGLLLWGTSQSTCCTGTVSQPDLQPSDEHVLMCARCLKHRRSTSGSKCSHQSLFRKQADNKRGNKSEWGVWMRKILRQMNRK